MDNCEVIYKRRSARTRIEFQAIIMAAGHGSRMTDLTVQTPKPLLPIGNKPMVWHPVNMLEKAGFKEAIMVVTKSSLPDIQKSLEEICHVGICLDYVTIPDNEELGTADTLRLIKDKIKTDVLIVSCDLMTDVTLQHLADVHRTQDADVTMLLAPAPDISQMSVPCAKTYRTLGEEDFIAIDEKSNNRVVFLKSDSDVKDKIYLPMSCLRRHPNLIIHKDLIDAHLYLMKKSMLDILVEDKSISMIKGELLPVLVNKILKNKSHKVTQVQDDYQQDYDPDYDLDYQIKHTSTYCNSSSGLDEKHAKCFAYIHKEGHCLRANTLITYCEANRQMAKQAAAHRAVGAKQVQASTDSLIGEYVTTGEKVGIKWSVIGDHCKIKDHVKISNCVIMDHVSIGSGATLSGCIVGQDTHILDKVELKDCIVGSKQTMKTGKFSNEVLVDANQMEIK